MCTKHGLAARVSLDETKAFLGVEEFTVQVES